MLDFGGDDVVAHAGLLLSEGDAFDRGVDGFCAVSREDNLLWAAAKGLRYRAP